MVEERTLAEVQERLNPKVETDCLMKGMLERDQRTVLNRSESVFKKPNYNVLLHTRRRNRLGQALAFGACLLSIVRFPSAMAAPTRRSIHEQEALWVNPCGPSGFRNTDYDSNEMSYHYDDIKILEPIILLANNSLTHAKLFRDQYVRKTFEHDFAKQLQMWSYRSVHYDWLPSEEQVPKTLGEPTSPEHLENLKIDDVLLDTYEYLQKMAVGLEQVVWDQNENNGEFIENFKDAESGLRVVLCEIQMAVVERKLTPRPDVTRDIMNEDMRVLNDTHRKLRDWVIFRDYMNCLEYVIEVLEYFKNNPAKLGPS